MVELPRHRPGARLTAKKGKKAPAKTAAKSPGSKAGLIPQPHGGALLAGGKVGNKGGTGRPANEVRERLLESVKIHSPGVVDDIASGKPTQTTRILLASLLPHVRCPNCNDKLEPEDPESLPFLEIEATISASPRDRIAALEFASKYGLGPVKEVSVDSVRERVTETLDALHRHVSPEQYAAIVQDIEPIWT